jgi:hypothetical protein
MKEKRRTLPKAIGPLEQLDSRITPATVGIRGTLAAGLSFGTMTAHVTTLSSSSPRPIISNTTITPFANRPSQLSNVPFGTLSNSFGGPFGFNNPTSFGVNNGSLSLSTTLSQLLSTSAVFNNGANGNVNNLGAINSGLSPTSPLGQLLLGSGGSSSFNGINGGFNSTFTTGMGLTSLFPSFNNTAIPTSSGLSTITGFAVL